LPFKCNLQRYNAGFSESDCGEDAKISQSLGRCYCRSVGAPVHLELC
jgi:hypothetical protein